MGDIAKVRPGVYPYPGKRALAPVKNVADAKFAGETIPAH